VTSKDPAKRLPTSVRKSYFLLGAKERDVLNQSLSKYRPGQSEPILIGGEKLLNPALIGIFSVLSQIPAKVKRWSSFIAIANGSFGLTVFRHT
jgi:hypothetical protein